MRRLSPPATDAAHFDAELTRLRGRPWAADERIAIAVSGGPDSLGLLLLAHAALGTRTVALTVDHGLRADAAAEAAMVADVCAARGIDHVTLRWEGAKPAANLQAAAREARYALMRDWCAAHGVNWLATAHHRDDVAETLLMRLARGAGLAGLIGPRPHRDLGQGVTLLRPLLGATHAELVALVAATGLQAVDDPANHAPRFDRTGARALLAATPWLDPDRLARSAQHLAQAETALGWAAGLAWNSRVEVEGDVLWLDVAGLPDEITRRVLLRALRTLSPDATPRGPDIERLMAACAAGHAATLAGVQVRGGPRWRLRRLA
ncbi:tRNA lysidine(34) synthetase TilS [Polymorphobacter arshaanensis]|uniref:tRNA(Ile)-lysidine synthase n=1 Tax=Glacieibacterium arshaanense TaxID=2511025 RepID=A0A4Y9EKR9_9SPHN|nr:tRNA lysidine(34) synthetase TilS [Polymorphobacter arshaanensis]TFU01363.1 tRNA lysidine(34) synthetase TilS [Polymorphobacter arshaanensis]